MRGFAKVVKVCHGGVGGHETIRGDAGEGRREVAPGKGGKLWRLLLLLHLLLHHQTSQLTQEGFQGSRETQASPWPKGSGYKAECPPCFEREGRRNWRDTMENDNYNTGGTGANLFAGKSADAANGQVQKSQFNFPHHIHGSPDNRGRVQGTSGSS